MSERSDHSGTPAERADTHWSQVAQRHYEPAERGELTTTIVAAIGEAEGVAPSEVKSPPLYDCVDVPAIEDAFFGPSGGETTRQSDGTVEFRYTDYLVKVGSDGWVRVYEATETEVA